MADTIDTPPPVGTRAQHANGSIVTWDGHNWVQTAAARPNGSRGNDGLSPQDRTQLGAMRSEAAGSADAERTLARAQQANHDLQSGPWRGTFLNATIPTEGEGILKSYIGAPIIGGLARMMGAISEDDVNNYQTLQRARNQGVLAEQRRQAGVQTEGDAARMAMAGLNVDNTVQQNEQVSQQGTQDAIRAQARAMFYASWASRYGGLQALNPQGVGVDTVWNGAQPNIIANFIRQRRGTAPPSRVAPPTIRRVR